MAIYDLGTASLSANGEVTGVGTIWKAPLTLIRAGATIVFKTEPVKIYTISEIISDTQINVYNPNSETVPAGTGYAILAHDGITVQGLAQDVAETLRYYQSRETEVADAVDAFNNFDIANFESKVSQVNAQHGDVVSIGAQVSADAAQVTVDKNAAAASAASAAYDKDAAAASAQEAADYAASLDTQNLLRKDLSLSDLTDKQLARSNLDVYSKSESEGLVDYKYGYPASSPAGAVQRKIQEKLNDFAFLEDFGGKADNGATDNGPAFMAAFAAGVTNIKLGSSGVYAVASGNIELPERFNITGKGDGCEIKYLGIDGSFTMFTLKGSQGASNWKNGGTFSDVVISSENQAMTWFLGEYIQNVNLERVVLYNSRTIVNDFHYMNFNTCRLIASGFTGRANLPGSTVSESPKFIGCFASNSPIDIKDTADLAIIGSTMFAGEYIVQTGTERDNIIQPDLRKGFPVLFSNSVFDAGQGSAWRLENVAYANISGCFVSCGRTYNSDGAYLDKVYDTSISNCTFTYCGRFGLSVERSNKISIVGCNFNGNKEGGLALINSENINVVGGSAGNSYIQGGYYIQPIGITSPADNCKNVVVTGFNFGPELATKYYFGTDASRGNRVVSCTGVLDSVFRGGSSDRPSGASYGQQFFDTSLGQPIWWNSVSSTWKNALGEDV